MQRVSDRYDGAGTRRASTRSRWLFALVMFTIGIVPMTEIAKAVGPAKAPACPGATYSVVGGDSWSRIATRVKVSMTALMNANAATTATVIHPGQTLCLPATATVAPTTTPTTAPTSTPPPAPGAKPVTTVAIAAFPVQGLCSFSDTYAAPRAGGRVHEGVDIIAKAGQWIYAVADGTLTRQYLNTPGSLSGNGWRLTGADGTYFFYAHLSAFAPGLSVGSPVKAGQIIGQVGMTGNAPIPHLHFEVHPGGAAAVNPTPIVKVVDACKVTAVPAQPNGAMPAPPAAAPATTVPASATTVPAPATTAPAPPAPAPAAPFPAHRRGNPTLPVPEGRARRPLPPSGA